MCSAIHANCQKTKTPIIVSQPLIIAHRKIRELIAPEQGTEVIWPQRFIISQLQQVNRPQMNSASYALSFSFIFPKCSLPLNCSYFVCTLSCVSVSEQALMSVSPRLSVFLIRFQAHLSSGLSIDGVHKAVYCLIFFKTNSHENFFEQACSRAYR